MNDPALADALMGEEMDPATDGGMFGDMPAPEGGEGDGLELGAADETELDPVFAADAASLFPDWSDEDYLKLQTLIDSRLGAGGL